MCPGIPTDNCTSAPVYSDFDFDLLPHPLGCTLPDPYFAEQHNILFTWSLKSFQRKKVLLDQLIIPDLERWAEVTFMSHNSAPSGAGEERNMSLVTITIKSNSSTEFTSISCLITRRRSFWTRRRAVKWTCLRILLIFFLSPSQSVSECV